MDDIQYYKQQLNWFKHVIFKPEQHEYIINNNVAQSVTTILKRYVKPFARDYWANIKAKESGVTADEIIAQWEYSAKLSQTKGSIIHAYLESCFNDGGFVYPEQSILSLFGHDPIQDPFSQIVPVVNQFLADIKDKMLPIVSEFVVGDSEYLVGGTLDQIFYNKRSQQLEIWDWKTNKEIKRESRYFHLAPLEHIPDTELDHYSLQLALYKLIVERNTGLQIGNCYLTWFNESQPKYHIFKARDYKVEAQLILEQIR